MSTSRERLNMENDTKRGSSLFSSKQGGLYLSRRALVWCAAFFLLSLVAVGLLVHFLAPCRYPKDAASVVQDSSSTTSDSTTDISPAPALDLRLPRSLQPKHYVLRLQPFLAEDNFTFAGHVEITIECLQSTSLITLHGTNLTVASETVHLRSPTGGEIMVKELSEDTQRLFLLFNLETSLEAGQTYTLTMDFTGLLTDTLTGFYRSSYEDKTTTSSSDSSRKWMATTQFQPTDARKAFPCFDEPGFKATFDVTLVRPSQMMSLSNMPLASDTEKNTNNQWVADHYQTTKKMSTYLLAFIVCDFAFIEDNTSNPRVKFTVFSRKEAINQSVFALKTGPKILNFYESFFNVDYPLPKQDMIAIPDFGAGAMENWGLITFRETALLFDPKVSSISSRQRVAVVISHELAHQWFGNLVTPLWWDDLWLNEGFASYVEYLGVDHAHPEWRMMDQFLIDEVHQVFQMDSLKSSHPVSVPVANPDEINEIFDHISYAKGASILRMMHHYLGNDVFRQGVKNYLNDKAYNNAVQNELWEHLTQAAKDKDQSKINVKTIMDTWTVQTGYPVVTVMRNYAEQSMVLTQHRFFLSKANIDDDTRWEIPITFTTNSERNFNDTLPKQWLHKDGESLKLTTADKVPSAADWVIVNLQQMGYYRVNYDTENWKQIIAQLNSDHKVINPLNRAQILNDALNLARAGLLDYGIALNATQYLTKETEFVPFKAALMTVEYVEAMLTRTAAYGNWKLYLSSKIKPLYDAVTFEDITPETEEDIKDSEHISRLIRKTVVAHACSLKLPDCLNSSKLAFQQWMKNNVSISPNLKLTVICTGLELGGFEEWNYVWQRYLQSNVASEKSTFLKALGCTMETWILSKYLDMTLTSKEIRSQDITSVIGAVAKNNIGRYLAYNFVRDKWMALRDKFSAGAFTLSKLVTSSMRDLNTRFELQELHVFKDVYKGHLASSERALKQIIEETETNVEWMENNYDVIDKWLQANT